MSLPLPRVIANVNMKLISPDPWREKVDPGETKGFSSLEEITVFVLIPNPEHHMAVIWIDRIGNPQIRQISQALRRPEVKNRVGDQEIFLWSSLLFECSWEFTRVRAT